jgi:hypothetical protein
LGKLAAFDDVADFAHQLGLELFFLWMIKAKVGEHISAATLDGDFVGHVLAPFT